MSQESIKHEVIALPTGVGCQQCNRLFEEVKELKRQLADLKKTFSARAVRVVDGDTVDCLVELGLGVSKQERVRLWKVLAPELDDPYGPECKAMLENLLVDELKLHCKGRDRYGRLVAAIETRYVTDIGPELMAAIARLTGQMPLAVEQELESLE